MVRWSTTSGWTTNHETPENPANHRPLLRVPIVVVVVSRLSTWPTVLVLYPVSMLNTLPPREWLDLLPLEMQQSFFHDAVAPPWIPGGAYFLWIRQDSWLPLWTLTFKFQVQSPTTQRQLWGVVPFFLPSFCCTSCSTRVWELTLSLYLLINIWWPSKLVFLQCWNCILISPDCRPPCSG